MSGCASENDATLEGVEETVIPVEEEIPVEEGTEPISETTLWEADGVIMENEYRNMKEFGNGRFIVYWSNDDEYIYMALKGQTSGWVSIGFEPTQAMMDADMIFGWISGNTCNVLDIYSTGMFGPHPPDIDLGGTDDILEKGCGQENRFTIIEFKRKMDTGDVYDESFVRGQTVNIIWGLGSAPSFDARHIQRGSGTIQLN